MLIRLLILIPTLSLGQVMAADPPSNWPEGWKDSYLRFEAFKQAKEKSFPNSNLRILSDGEVIHGVQFREERAHHLYVCLFAEKYKSPLKEHPAPGVYAIGLKVTTGNMSYQYLYPLLWVEVQYPGDKKTIREIADRNLIEKRWPSEQLLKFIDFHAYLGGNPNDFHGSNVAVNPSLALGVTPDGVLSPDAIDPALRKLLHWRIYHNGQLIEDGPVSEALRYDANRGMGEYHAFLGVEGPDGFMPVSNYLHYPLFPTEGRALLFPPMDGAGLPRFFSRLFTQEQMAELAQTPEDHERGQGYNKNSVYKALELAPEPKQRELYELWMEWAWEIWQFKRGPESTNWRVPLR